MLLCGGWRGRARDRRLGSEAINEYYIYHPIIFCFNELYYFYRPVNLLTFTPDRAINVVLFGALSGEIYSSLYESHNVFGRLEIDPYLSILVTTGMCYIIIIITSSCARSARYATCV